MDTSASGPGETAVIHPVKKKKTATGQAPDAGGASKGAVPKRRKQPTPSNPADQLLNSNPFAALPVDVTDNGKDVTEKREKVPPLFTSSIEVPALRTAIGQLNIRPIFKICATGTKITCSTLAEFYRVGEFLRENNQKFYTHDVPGTKPLKVVIRGLPSLLVEEVKAALLQLGLKPVGVHVIARRDQTRVYQDKLYLVHLEKGSTTLAALQQIRAICQIGVRWELYRPQHREVTQCQRCLAFGHGTKNCHMDPRCGRCCGPHITNACTNATEDAKCVNCDQDHLGNDRRCPKRAEFVRIRQQASSRNQPGRHRKPPPANTPAQYPPLQPRRVIPVLDPLPLPNNNQPPRGKAATKFSAQPRLAAAAAEPSAAPGCNQATGYTPPPGLSYAGVTAGSFTGAPPSAPPDNEEEPMPYEEFYRLAHWAMKVHRQCTTRSQQYAAIFSLIQNGP